MCPQLKDVWRKAPQSTRVYGGLTELALLLWSGATGMLVWTCPLVGPQAVAVS